MPLGQPRAVVVVLSSEFVRKRHPMAELALLLKRKRQDGCFRLLPILYGISFEQCVNLATTGYAKDVWIGGEERPAEKVLQKWAGMVKELLTITAIHEDQVGSHQEHLGSIGYSHVLLLELQGVPFVAQTFTGAVSPVAYARWG